MTSLDGDLLLTSDVNIYILVHLQLSVMVIKSLTITEEAYNVLKSIKHGDESFSKAIIRIGKRVPVNIEKYIGIIKRSDDEVKEWKSEIKSRRKEIDFEFKEKGKKHMEKLYGSS